MEDTIFIFGHRNPDTDSVCSAISLSYLQNSLGLNTEPRILSSINEETKYVLKKFQMKTPQLLNDVRLQVKDVNYHKSCTINYKDSVYNAFFKMQSLHVSSIPVINDNNKFLGIFAMKDIAKNEIMNDTKILNTTYNHILDVIKGKEILKINNEINGNIINIDLRSSTFSETITLDHKSILITGDRHSLIEEAINKKIKLLLLTNNTRLKNEHLLLAKNHNINVIYTSLESYEAIQKIKFANYIDSYNYQKDITCINENMTINDLNDIIKKTKYSYYPVVDNKNNCLGLIKLSDLNDYRRKKVILVDHNELTQSVDGLEEAEITGIFDHHKLGNLGTNHPINFRNMTLGSTCTIIYELFKENKVSIPKVIASLLLCGIISDTLLLKSPTTTDIDRQAFKDLEKIAKVDAKKLAIEMFKANDIANSKSIKEIVYNDFKEFNIDKKSIGIGVITTLNSKAIIKQKNSYIRFLNKESKIKNYDLLLLVITDIFNNGSYLLFNSDASELMSFIFNKDVKEGDFFEDLISRKKQIVPAIMNSII